MEMSLVGNLAAMMMLVTLNRTWLHFPAVAIKKTTTLSLDVLYVNDRNVLKQLHLTWTCPVLGIFLHLHIRTIFCFFCFLTENELEVKMSRMSSPQTLIPRCRRRLVPCLSSRCSFLSVLRPSALLAPICIRAAKSVAVCSLSFPQMPWSRLVLSATLSGSVAGRRRG